MGYMFTAGFLMPNAAIKTIIDTLNILIDQMIEPIDIIWENIGGGDRGLFVGRRIILNLITIALLLFVTTPMNLFSTMQKFKYFQFLQFEFIIKIKYGYIIITYIYPIIILIINIGLIELIDYICILEKNYTHSNYHCSFFEKSFIYMLLNFLIIPSLALSYEPLYQIFKYNFKEIKNLLSGICDIYNNYYFYITLFIQNGTFGFIFYLLRINELIFNFFSTTITYYKSNPDAYAKNRHSQNNENQFSDFNMLPQNDQGQNLEEETPITKINVEKNSREYEKKENQMEVKDIQLSKTIFETSL